MDRDRRQRLADNEIVFRDFNDTLAGLVEAERGVAYERRLAFSCECSDVQCAATVRASIAEYQSVRRDERRFLIVCGHDQPAIESVVEEHDSYCVVRKKEDLAA